jgi:quercetin dioxygenase-like cupin family protein
MTGAAFSIIEHPLDPGRLIPPHIHYKEDELSYVVSGEIGVRIGDRDYLAGPGSYVFKPATSRTRSGTRVPSRRI